VTDGGEAVTSGGGRRSWLTAWLAFAAIAAVLAAINALSAIDDRARIGRPVPAWEPWTWELTSFAAWLTVAPLVFVAARKFRPPRLPWPLALAAHVAASAAVSLAHVTLMVALRELAYAAAGAHYAGGPILDLLIYEYRKDAVTYALLALLLLGLERLRPAPPRAPGDPARIEVRDGSRTLWLAPDDIDWAQAAGNYVELHGGFGTVLHRQTLAALEQALGPHGFCRVHRSRIVRAGAVRSIETRPSGDFEITLASGERIGGSRRFRERLA
jgi:DNA-binding LytR/AlgR family response regulator